MTEPREDSRLRPVVLQTSAPEPDHARSRSVRFLGWAGGIAVGVVAAAGLVAGGSAIWSAVDPGSPAQSPAPLWIQPPAPVEAKATQTPTPVSETTTPDDRGRGRDHAEDSASPTSGRSSTEDRSGRRGGETTAPTSSSTEDRSGRRGGETTAPTSSTNSDDHGGRSGSGSDDSGSGSDNSGSGSESSGSGSDSSGKSGSGSDDSGKSSGSDDSGKSGKG